ncbi:LysR family transcriptional regulator [Solirubrobacter pauli]|nr:LysR family transcriptional regulator [Solirubrobacter pauli]
MDLRRVRSFVAVAEELHFRRAAERLYVTQPVVSEHVRKLESELGVQLFERTSQFVRLTEAGAAFLVDVRGLLAQAAEIEEAARRARDVSATRLRVGLTPDVLPAALPGALRTLRERHDLGPVQLRVDGCGRLLDDVQHRRADAAIVVLPAPVGGFRVVPVATEHAAVVAATARGRPVAWAELAAEPLFVLARATSPGFHDSVTASFVAEGLHPRLVDHPAATLEQLLLDVSATGRRAIVPASAGARLAMLGTLLTPVAGGVAAHVAVVSRDEPVAPGLAAFVAALTAATGLRAAA